LEFYVSLNAYAHIGCIWKGKGKGGEGSLDQWWVGRVSSVSLRVMLLLMDLGIYLGNFIVSLGVGVLRGGEWPHIAVLSFHGCAELLLCTCFAVARRMSKRSKFSKKVVSSLYLLTQWE
jgi:hypothetical protein